jgi:aminocarboxymuconate-semialdehyde decarboxylase
MLRYLIDQVGPERLMLGTDYPFPLGEAEPGKLIRSLTDLAESVEQQLLGRSAVEWLGLGSPCGELRARG